MNTAPTPVAVDVLTAEVRALMVGKRQVTLSVYRQLDTVPATEIEPFGRVRDKAESGLEVIGRHTTTDALVRSITPAKPNKVWLHFEETDTDSNRISHTVVCKDDITVRGSFLRWRSTFVHGNYTGDTPHYIDDYSREYVESVARDAAAQRIAEQKHWAGWAALPLIVLAGLR